MEPVTLLLAALAAGATAGIKDTAGDAIKDVYKGLRSLIQRKFAGKPEAEVALAEHEEKPEVWELPLKDSLIETGADKDQEIIEAAEKLMTLLNPQQAADGKYSVHFHEKTQGVSVGDHGHTTMNFGNKPTEE